MTLLRRVSLLSLTMLLAFILGCAATSTRESTGEYVDDATITAKVKTAFIAESSLKSTEISVETFKGVVQLSGFVSSSAQVATAVEVARRIKGVKDIHNDTRIKGQK